MTGLFILKFLEKERKYPIGSDGPGEKSSQQKTPTVTVGGLSFMLLRAYLEALSTNTRSLRFATAQAV